MIRVSQDVRIIVGSKHSPRRRRWWRPKTAGGTRRKSGRSRITVWRQLLLLRVMVVLLEYTATAAVVTATARMVEERILQRWHGLWYAGQ